MSDQPNLLFIMTDQWRYDYLGCAGTSFVSTPNIDRLAARGLRFTHCHTNAPVCTPARLSLACGLHPFRIGALDNHAYLPARTPTYYQQLRDHGYRVGCVGKLDLAKPASQNGWEGRRPLCYSWGFTDPVEVEGKMHAGKFDQPQGPYGHWLAERGEFASFRADYQSRGQQGWAHACGDSVLPTEAWADSYIGRRSVEWIEGITDEYPWHLFVSFVGPHDPFDPPREWAERFRETEVPEPIPMASEGKPDWIRSRQQREAADAATTRRCRQQYIASCALIDDWIGKILDALDARGMRENTWIIFASDHGEMLGDHGLFTKSCAYEPSWRVPLIIAGPGGQAGQTSDALVELSDLNPTLTDLAGVPSLRNIDARSLTGLIEDPTRAHRQTALAVGSSYRTIRHDRYKYIENYNQKSELYDLQSDPDEQTNLAADHPEVTRQLASLLKDRMIEGGYLR